MTGTRTSPLRVGAITAALAFVVMIANGRPIGSGDTHAVEETAAAFARHGSLVVASNDVGDPFTRPVPGGRIAIYPPLSALLAAPLFRAFAVFFDLDFGGTQIAGKMAAAALSSLAVGIMTAAFSRRASSARAIGAGLVFGLGTSVYSTSQALWQHPAELVFFAAALYVLECLGKGDDVSAARVFFIGIALALAGASRTAAIPMLVVVFGYLVFRSGRWAWLALLGASIPVTLVGLYNQTYFGAPWSFGPSIEGRFLAAFPQSLAGLAISPARGLLVFTPIAALALWSLLRAARARFFPRALVLAVAAHIGFISCWNEWHGGESFGPRLLTDMLPAWFFYLPEAFLPFPVFARFVAALSIGIQVLGGWTYDNRWERIHQRGQDFNAALWSWRDSPILFELREGVVIQGTPKVEGRIIRFPPYRFVPFGSWGSLIEPAVDSIRVSGRELVRDVRLERGGRSANGTIVLSHPADALALRSLSKQTVLLELTGRISGIVRVETEKGATRIISAGVLASAVSLSIEDGEDVFIRAESGELRLSRVQLSPAGGGAGRRPI